MLAPSHGMPPRCNSMFVNRPQSCHKQLLHLSNLPDIEAPEDDAPEAADKDGRGSDASKQSNHENSMKMLGEVEVKLLLFHRSGVEHL